MRSNSEQWDVEDLGVATRQQTWEIRYAYSTLIGRVQKRYALDKIYGVSTSPYKACQYQRSANICRNHLKEVGLITEDNKPVMKAILKTAQQYATEPEFKVEYVKGIYSTETIKSPLVAYRDIGRLDKREFFFYYLNGGKYNRIMVKKKMCRSEVRDVSKLKIFPKARYQELISNICYYKMKDFLDKRLPLKSKIFYDLELKNIGNDTKFDPDDIEKFSPTTPITTEEMETRMQRALDVVSFYQRAYEDLKAMRDRLAKGSVVRTEKETYTKVITYMQSNAPLYINEEDKELKMIASLILKNASKEQIASEWLNPLHGKLIDD